LFQRFFLSHQINAFICRIHNASFFFTNWIEQSPRKMGHMDKFISF
jgi:hypothetical protein